MSVLMAEVQDHCRVAIRQAWSIVVSEKQIHFAMLRYGKLMALNDWG